MHEVEHFVDVVEIRTTAQQSESHWDEWFTFWRVVLFASIQNVDRTLSIAISETERLQGTNAGECTEQQIEAHMLIKRHKRQALEVQNEFTVQPVALGDFQ